ncbi:hypothetical protein BGZ94_004755 [Podila epigama]|nr:hypothetical protein BGZ94_004755 [Podila epigama]
MDGKQGESFMVFLKETADEDQNSVAFFEWAKFPSYKEGYASAVWKTVEEWSKRLESINDKEKDVVVEHQHKQFLKFMEDKNSPFIDSDDPSPPYTPTIPSKRPREAFAGGSESSWEVLTSGDIIDALQEMLPNQRMGDILGVAQGVALPSLTFRHAYPEDALALSATLLIKKNSRSPQLNKAFGVQRLTSLRESLLQLIVPALDATVLDKQTALISKWVGWIGMVSESRRENSVKRKRVLERLQGDWAVANDLDLTALHTYFMMSIQGLFASQPLDFQEADGIASFIRNLLVTFLHEVDLVRFSCTDKSSEASRYNKLINQLPGRSKQPDLVGMLIYEGVKVETFFGEASSVSSKSPCKYGGDTVRLGVFGKNSHDMMDNLLDLNLPLLLFNIDGLVVQAFVLKRMHDIYTMVEIGIGRIPCSVNDLLFLSQDLPFWLQLREIARMTSSSVVQAVDANQVNHDRRKTFYPTITTPSAKQALRSSK